MRSILGRLTTSGKPYGTVDGEALEGLGYCEQFCKFFKKHTGNTPSEFRKSLQWIK